MLCVTSEKKTERSRIEKTEKETAGGDRRKFRKRFADNYDKTP